jgi:hypothetical protein
MSDELVLTNQTLRADHAPALTEEELADIDAALDDEEVERPNSEVVRYVYRTQVRRLLADLRAARERIKELEDGIEAYLSGQNPL